MFIKYITTFIILVNSSLTLALPGWVKDTSLHCESKKFICAVGSGVSRLKAEQNARVQLAKIFHNKIESSFKQTTSSTSTKLYENTSEILSESTSIELEGIETSKVAEDKLSFYVLVQLNKKKAAKEVKELISSIDEKMISFADDPNPNSAVKLERFFNEREVHAKRYRFLTGRSIPSRISFDQIIKTKKAMMDGIYLHVFVEEEEPKVLEPLILKIMSDTGYNLFSGNKKNQHATHTVLAKIDSKKVFLDVKGFVKYDFDFSLTVKDRNKVETGHLSFTTSQNGRNEKQAMEKGIKEIKMYIQENVSELNIQ